MIRNNTDIKGVLVNNIEFKISQYADDTQIILNGNEESLVEALKCLNFFYKISGLKINIEKN